MTTPTPKWNPGSSSMRSMHGAPLTLFKGAIEFSEGRQPDAHHICPNFFHNCLHHLQTEAAPVLNGSAILICTCQLLCSKPAKPTKTLHNPVALNNTGGLHRNPCRVSTTHTVDDSNFSIFYPSATVTDWLCAMTISRAANFSCNTSQIMQGLHQAGK